MKFFELALGTQFEHKNLRYEKISKVIGLNLETGKQKFFKRSDIVSTHASQQELASPPKEHFVDAEQVKDALCVYHQKNADILHRLNLSNSELTETLQQLEQARKDCLARLNIVIS